jgi:hypothetical protein
MARSESHRNYEVIDSTNASTKRFGLVKSRRWWIYDLLVATEHGAIEQDVGDALLDQPSTDLRVKDPRACALSIAARSA